MQQRAGPRDDESDSFIVRSSDHRLSRSRLRWLSRERTSTVALAGGCSPTPAAPLGGAPA